MSMTPEGQVKNAVKKLLEVYAPLVTGHWPVQNGMGKPMLDYHGCCVGLYFAIECKKDGHEPLTPRQALTCKELEAAQAKVFLVRSVNGTDIQELDEWLHHRVMEFKRLKGPLTYRGAYQKKGRTTAEDVD